jgi:3-oxoacyl-[acyl-carrier-protein] synthase II
MRVQIQGIGCVGAFGCGRNDLAQALARGGSPVQMVPVGPGTNGAGMPALLADTAPLSNFLPPRSLRRIDHFSRMALLGAYLALDDAKMNDLDRSRLGVIIATGYGATQSTFRFLDSSMDHGDICASPIHFSNSVHNSAAAHLSILLHATGPSLTISQFEMSVATALLCAMQWLKEERVDAVLVGGVDECGPVLAYCYQQFFGKPNALVQPFCFSEQTAVAGEGAAFMLLTRHDQSAAPLGLIDTVTLSHLCAGPPDLSNDVWLVLGADGQRCCGEHYAKAASSSTPAAAFAPVWGSLPVGQAFDILAAALMLQRGFDFAPYLNAKEGPADPTVDALCAKPIVCLKCGSHGEYGRVKLVGRF